METGEGGADKNEVDAWRDAIMVFVNDFYEKLQSQLTCPARNPDPNFVPVNPDADPPEVAPRDPRACYQCVDTQVLACLVRNEAVLNYIQLRKK